MGVSAVRLMATSRSTVMASLARSPWPMMRRNWASASSIPAAVQRRHMSPDCQRLTLRLMRRTVSIIDSHGFVEASVRLSGPRTPEAGDGEGLLEAFAQRRGRAGVAAVQLGGEHAELVERAVVVIERPRHPQAPAHERPVTLGQVAEHVALSLKYGVSSRAAAQPVLLRGWGDRLGSVLFRRLSSHTVSVGAVPAAQFLVGRSVGQNATGVRRGRSCRAAGARGGEGLLERQDVPAGDQDLARDGGLGGVALAAAALLDVEVELMPWVVRSPRLLGGLDRRPAQHGRAGPRELAGAGLLPGLVDARCQPGVADELAGGREARDVADLAGDRETEQIADPGDRDQQPDASVGARQRPQLLLDRDQAFVEHPDNRDRLGDRAPPDL